MIEPTDTFLEVPAAIRNTNTVTVALSQSSAKAPPIPEATPLPPLNLYSAGKTCPRITPTNATIPPIAPWLPPIPNPILTATIAFRISPANVIRAGTPPRTLRTLVVPALPLPSFLTSTPIKLPRIIAGEILPKA